MDAREPKDEPLQKPLRREVEFPIRQQSGLGLVMVASAAMFFAVASSAFLIRARMDVSRCPHSQPYRVRAVPVNPQPSLLPRQSSECGEAIYRKRPDGTVVVDFQLCEPSEISPVAAPANP